MHELALMTNYFIQLVLRKEDILSSFLISVMAVMLCGCLTFSLELGSVTLVTESSVLNFQLFDKTADKTAS